MGHVCEVRANRHSHVAGAVTWGALFLKDDCPMLAPALTRHVLKPIIQKVLTIAVFFVTKKGGSALLDITPAIPPEQASLFQVQVEFPQFHVPILNGLNQWKVKILSSQEKFNGHGPQPWSDFTPAFNDAMGNVQA